MPVVLATRADIDLEAVRRVAWGGEAVELAPVALERMAVARRSFLELLETDTELVVYGVTSGYGERASVRLTPEERKEQAARPPHADATFGDPLPGRVVRAIVLARLANFLEGHAAVRPELAAAVAGLLDGRPLPDVPVRGNGGAGEILALSHVFAPLGARLRLQEKETLALINGSPCAAALVADAALAGRNRLALAHETFALSAEALGAPLEAYAPELEELWGDDDEAAALRALRALLAGSPAPRRAYQAPVSYRILARVLGQAHQALALAEEAAAISLRSVTDNPVYLPPDDDHPLGRVWSTGGYHNGKAYPALDALAAAWANLAALAERHVERLLAEAPVARAGSDAYLGLLLMVSVGHSEEARATAQPTFLPRGGFAQNDVPAPSFLAWDKERIVGERLDACLAVLAAVASQALWAAERPAAPPLEPFLAGVRETFPPVERMRSLGRDCERLARAFGERVRPPTG